ncbi:hypothetical protein [Kurthia sp. Dielmo]|uniref:hypothetical protein n=1 Tax=Kurthia sp. Dielmo TaxID=1033738 RepID=UPI001648C8DE|nr:hypothetical protein [Kurthia sp. Dielmo]
MFKKVLIMLMASFLVYAIGSAFGTSSIAAQKIVQRQITMYLLRVMQFRIMIR